MSKKLFEQDISRSLTALGLYYYKPIDIMQAGADKVDYFVCVRGKFVAIEVKQVPGGTCPPSQFSEGQKLCLRSVAQNDGLALVIVNFRRRPLHRDKGTATIYQVDHRDDWESFREGEGVWELEPTKGGWDLNAYFDWAVRSMTPAIK